MAGVRVLVIRAAGINCDEETVHSWRLAGAQADLMHINVVVRRPAIVDDYQIVTLPGGFSYGDDIAAGRILAQRMEYHLANALRRLVERGGGLLGICNGFQVLVRMGLLPGEDIDRDAVTLTGNDSARFEARWVRLAVCTDRCPFLMNLSELELPVEHAEGKVVTADDTVTRQLEELDRVAVRYVDRNGRSDTYPANPNGSVAGVAGLCDATGRILGLMPHPDRHFDHTHHPHWTRCKTNKPPDGLTVFLNAVSYWNGCG